jgi:hypothetical protein
MISRQELLEEQLLRKAIKAFLKKKITEQLQTNSKEVHLLSQAVRKKILQTEAKTGSTSPDSPLEITAMNFLRDLLRNIVPVIQSAYKALTTDVRQRQSFKAHVLAAVEDIINTESANPGEKSGNAEGVTEPELDEEINVEFDDEEADSTPEEEGFIEIEPPKKGPELSPEEEFSQKLGLDDRELDTTGRQQAMETMNAISKQISEKFNMIGSRSFVPKEKVPELAAKYAYLLKDNKLFPERSVFKIYLLKNLMLYFERFETELDDTPQTPEVKI